MPEPQDVIQCEKLELPGGITRVKGNLTGCVFTATGLEYMAHDDFVNLIDRNTGAFDCFSNRSNTEVYSGNVCEFGH